MVSLNIIFLSFLFIFDVDMFSWPCVLPHVSLFPFWNFYFYTYKSLYYLCEKAREHCLPPYRLKPKSLTQGLKLLTLVQSHEMSHELLCILLYLDHHVPRCSHLLSIVSQGLLKGFTLLSSLY
jgi:hypothetical protein